MGLLAHRKLNDEQDHEQIRDALSRIGGYAGVRTGRLQPSGFVDDERELVA